MPKCNGCGDNTVATYSNGLCLDCHMNSIEEANKKRNDPLNVGVLAIMGLCLTFWGVLIYYSVPWRAVWQAICNY